MSSSPVTPAEARPRSLAISKADAGRVLVVARWPVGGIRTHLRVNYPAAAAGRGVTIVGPDNESLADLQEAIPEVECVGVPVKGSKCRLWPTVRKLLQTGRFATIHSHGATAAVHSALARLGTRVPHIVTLHEPFRAEQFRRLTGQLKRWMLGRVLRQADAIITVSDDARENLLQYLPALRKRADRIVTIPNGIDVAAYTGLHTPCDGLRRQLNLDSETRLIGFLGRFMPEKGFPILLDAVSKLRAATSTTRFHIAAFGSGDYRREYRKRIDKLGLDGLVSMHDFVADVPAVLRQLDLVVVPSLWEASSLISMEAMAAGVPVLGSDCPGLREVLRGTPSRTVAAGDVDALLRGLLGALHNPWTDAAIMYASQARQRFDNAGSVARLAEMLNRVSPEATRRSGIFGA